MSVEPLHTDNAPKAIGPYSQAVRAGNLLFISGQLPINPSTGEIFTGDITEQTRLVLNNVKAILESQKLSLHHIAKATLFLKDMEDFAKVNQVYTEFFHDHKPARACVEVARLPKDAAIEIEAIASIA